MIGMIFDNVIFDGGPLRPALGPRLNINVSHGSRLLRKFLPPKL
jgi:hypothetical protein